MRPQNQTGTHAVEQGRYRYRRGCSFYFKPASNGDKWNTLTGAVKGDGLVGVVRYPSAAMHWDGRTFEAHKKSR